MLLFDLVCITLCPLCLVLHSSWQGRESFLRSDLGLKSLPMSHKRTLGLYGIKRTK